MLTTAGQTAWVPGTVHPTGGFDEVITEVDDEGWGVTSYYRDGLRHREDGPSRLTTMPSGAKHVTTYSLHGESVRVDGGPTYVTYYDTGIIEREIWSNPGGTTHRVEGPAWINYGTHGMPLRKEWIVDGVAHRTDGPAVIEYEHSGEVEKETFLYRDVEVEAEVWDRFGEAVAGGAPVEWALAYARGEVS